MKSYDEIIDNIDLDRVPKEILQKVLNKIRNTKINILVVGGTGAGKSSTINALFNMDVAKVGQSSLPETSDIRSFTLDNLIIWDTPGLGDSTENDRKYKDQIALKMQEKDQDNNLLIDLVLLILDGASRDYSSAYTLIHEIIAPNLGGDSHERLLIAINKADVALGGRYWNFERNMPEDKLVKFLEEKVRTTQKRIYDDTGLHIEVIEYSAGFKDNDEAQQPYNLAKLLDYFLLKIPSKKRISIVQDINKNEDNFEKNDSNEDYQKNAWEKIEKSFVDNIIDFVQDAIGFLREHKGKIEKVVTVLIDLFKK